MIHNTIFISKLIQTLIFNAILGYLFITNDVLIWRLLLIPFFISSIASFFKTFFLLKDEKKLANLCQKIYVISFLSFVVIILVSWNYTNIKEGNYVSLLFSIPFWGVAIYTAFKNLSSKKAQKKDSSRKKVPASLIISFFLIGICLLAGMAMLVLGTRDIVQLNRKTVGYKSVEGYYLDYEVYDDTDSDISYRLLYSYTVDGKEYTISTSLGTDIIPDQGSTRTIKYNPDNPKEAIIIGNSNGLALIFIGLMFTFIPGIIFVVMLQSFGLLKSCKFDIIGFLSGLIFIVISLGEFYMLTGSLSIISFIQNFSASYVLPTLVFLMMFIVGVYVLINSLRKKSKNKE